jgi:hypothetical protein
MDKLTCRECGGKEILLGVFPTSEFEYDGDNLKIKVEPQAHLSCVGCERSVEITLGEFKGGRF